MSQLLTIWTQLRKWIAVDAPDLEQNLQKGAVAKEILALEQHLGVTLPEDYKEFLSLCNGQADEYEASFYAGQLLSIADVQNQWNMWQELLENKTFAGIHSQPSKGIQNDWWNSKWIPFTHDGAGNHLCLDLAPTKDGTVGQVIRMWHDDPERTVKYPSFTAWLEEIWVGIETGKIVFDAEEYNALVDIDDIG